MLLHTFNKDEIYAYRDRLNAYLEKLTEKKWFIKEIKNIIKKYHGKDINNTTLFTKVILFENQYIHIRIGIAEGSFHRYGKKYYFKPTRVIVDSQHGKYTYVFGENVIFIQSPHFTKRIHERNDAPSFFIDKPGILYKRKNKLYELSVSDDYVMICTREGDIRRAITCLNKNFASVNRSKNFKELLKRLEQPCDQNSNEIYEWV
jgi:hypothetical protein